MVYYWHGLKVEGDLVTDAWQGDPSLPNGVKKIAPYLEDVCITAEDGTDITEYFSDYAIGVIFEDLL